MNILVLSWRDPKHPMAGGAEQSMHEHMRGWIEAGHSVTLFSSYFKGSTRDEKFDNVQVIRYGFQLLGVHIAAFFWYLFGKHQRYDIVVDQFHGIPFFTPLYMRIPKLAVVQEVARDVWFTNPLPSPINKIIGAIGYCSEPFVFFLYKSVTFMTGSQSAKEELQKMHIPSENITIVSHGVTLVVPKRIPKKEHVKTIMFLGAVTKDKGIEDALETFRLLSNKGNYQFWVAGKADSYYLSILGKAGKEKLLKGRLTYWGFVSQEKKFELLARALVMINPSILEGWGLVNIEANAMSTPVVAYRSPGLVDSVVDGKTGLLCEQNTPVSLASAIDFLLKDQVKLKRLQKGAYKWSEQFSWKKSRAKSLELINSLLKS